MNDLGLLLLRIGFSAPMLTHGIGKLQKVLSGNFAFADPLGFGEFPTLIVAVIGEVIAPVMIILGIKSRWASLPTIITMFVAFFIVHGGDAFANKELAFLYLVGFSCIALLGSGKFSLQRD